MGEDFLPVRVKPPPRAEVLFGMARNKAFPFCIIELEEKPDGIDKPVVKIQVNSSLYKTLKEIYKSDKITLYCSLTEDNTAATIGAFSYDLMLSYNFLIKLGLVEEPEEWVKKAQKSIEKEIKSK